MLWTKITGGLALVAAMAFAITSARLAHCKVDLTKAEAAQLDPNTKRPWRDEAVERAATLTTQTAAITQIALDGQHATDSANANLALARHASDAVAINAATILKTTPGSDKCASAYALMRESQK